MNLTLEYSMREITDKNEKTRAGTSQKLFLPKEKEVFAILRTLKDAIIDEHLLTSCLCLLDRTFPESLILIDLL